MSKVKMSVNELNIENEYILAEERIEEYLKILGIDVTSVQVFEEYIFIELWDKSDSQKKLRITWPDSEVRDLLLKEGSKSQLVHYISYNILTMLVGKERT